MCGRKTLTKGKQEIISEFLIDSWDDDFIFKPSYNIAPTNTVPIMLEKNGRNILPMKWGLIPFWSNENTYSKSKKLINARSETLTTKSSFKNLISQNRCVVISDGYYEWKKYGKNKIPFYIQNFDNNFLLMAGLYNIWKSKANEKIFTYTIITTKSNNELSFIHNRMPAILKKNELNIWLKNEKYSTENALNLLKPYSENLEFYEVSKYVNSVKNNSKECVKKI